MDDVVANSLSENMLIDSRNLAAFSVLSYLASIIVLAHSC